MIVVTGASGFIGSNLVLELIRRGKSSLMAVDNYPDLRGTDGVETRRSSRYIGHAPIARYLDWHDLPRWLNETTTDVDAILHIGACSDTTVSDREFIMAVNFEYIKTLWQWSSVNARPFLYASSAATYGDGSQGYDDLCDPSCYRPLNFYGESKHRFDLWALEQANAPPRWAGMKYFNVYGPREEHKQQRASAVFSSFHQIRESGRVQLFQSHREAVAHGGQQRDFVFVGDVVDATLHFLDMPVCPESPNGLYNIGTGIARTYEDLANSVFAALGRTPKIDYIPMPEDLCERYQYFTKAEKQKLERAGFERPFHSLEQGVSQYVRDYLLPLADAQKIGSTNAA